MDKFIKINKKNNYKVQVKYCLNEKLVVENLKFSNATWRYVPLFAYH